MAFRARFTMGDRAAFTILVHQFGSFW